MTVDIDRPRSREGALRAALASEVESVVELLRLRAGERGEQVAYTFLADGEEETERLTFAELDLRAREIGGALQAAGAEGRTVLLLYPPGLELVAGFFGCLYAGAVAVPAYPPRSKRSLPRLRSVARDSRPAAALTTTELRSRLESLGARVPELSELPAIATDTLEPGAGEGWHEPDAGPATLAFLQYTSGSTAAPKGVMVTHGNLLHNQEAIRRGFGQGESSVIVGWLPLYHDMGLIGNVLQPLYLGARCILMSPVAFLQKPVRWLRAVSRYRATTSGGPSFSYDLVARKARPEDLAGIDLSSWSVAFDGAEPVRAATLDRFAEAFAPYGFRRRAFYPCYGLAEATLFVTGGAPEEEPVVARFDPAALERGEAARTDGGEGRRLVSSGRAHGGQDVRVVDPESHRPLADGVVGEIWVRGPSVAAGYWRRPERTAEDFGARLEGVPEEERGPFLRTGDLGFFRGGELFVTGRRKDLVILRGRNLYPQDLERTAERAHPAFRPGCTAAFSVEAEGPDGGEEVLAIVQEVHRRHHGGDLEAMADAIRAAVAEEHEAAVGTVSLIRHGTILKTSSGKIRRSACRRALLDGELRELARSGGGTPREPDAAEAAEAVRLPSRDDLLLVAPGERRALLTAGLRGQLARAQGVDPARIDAHEPVLLDSLAAMELKGRLDAALRLDLPLEGLIEGPTLHGLTESLLDALAAPEGEDGATAPLPPVRAHGDGVEQGPLSYGQRALWLEHRLAPESPAYSIVLAARLRSAGGEGADAGTVRRALEALIARHPVLSGRIEAGGGRGPVQVYGAAGLDWVPIEDAGRDGEALPARLDEEAHRPFDLAAGPPLRARLFVRGEGAPPVLVLAIHHAAVDLRSLTVLLEELGVLYTALRAGRPPELPGPVVSHADYVAWQDDVVSSERGEALWAWWRERLAGFPRTLDLPADRPRPASRRMAGGAVPFDLPAEVRGALAALAREEGATLYMVVLAAFAALLARHAGQESLIVGSPAAGRPRPELRDLVGYLVNPLPLPLDAAGDPAFRELLGRVRETVLGALGHEAYPLLRLAERAAREGEGRADEDHGLFRTLFVLERPIRGQGPAGEGSGDAGVEAGEEVAPFVLGRGGGRLRLGDLELESVPFALRGAQVDLALTLVDGGPGRPLAGELRYDSDLFDRTTARRLARRLGALVTGALGDPSTPLSRLPLSTAAEAHQLRHEWNDRRVSYPRDERLDGLIAAQTERTPERIALVYGSGHLSYAGLARRVDALAARLRALGVGPEVRVGVCAERSAALVIGLRAVIEAGGAYVPLDPEYPPERLAYIVEDAAAPVVLTTRELLERLPGLAGGGTEVVLLDTPAREAAAPVLDAGPSPGRTASALAYTIYTSGSTGRPKGAMNAHAGIVNRLLWMRDEYRIGDGDRVLQKTPFSFDVSVWELFLPSLAGATLVMARPGGHQEPVYLVETIEREAITTVHFVPSMLQVFLQAVESGVGECPRLLRVIVSGEALPADLRDRFRQHLASELHNLYGPTEAAVDVTAWPTGDDPPGTAVPIGRPVANTAIRILDRHARPVPIGVPGELHIGGVQVGRGYLGRPALTARRYVPDPYAEISGERPGARLYRTGDLARFRPDGAVDFLGRIDHQVKLRGFRIELGEIEAVLESHPGVREAVVTAWGSPGQGPGGARLVAYLVAAGEEAPAAEALRGHLAESLPEYMVPAAFTVLEAFPLTPSGKVNRRALPDPDRGDTGPRSEPPRPGTEQRLAALWREVLARDDVGRDDHFFRLGGHSLLAAQLATRIGAELGVELPLRVAFERPTVASLAAWIDGRAGSGGGAAGDLDWWRERLAGASAGTGLPTDRPRFAAGGVRPFPLEAERIEALGASGDAPTTLPAVLLAVWAVLLARYTGEDDLVIGVAAGAAESAGQSPGLLPVRLDLSDRPGFAELAARAARELAAALAHGPVRADRLVRLARALGAPGGAKAVAPLFQTGFVVEEADPSGSRPRLAPGALRRSGGLPGQTLDLAFWAAPSPAGGIEARVEYDRDLFDDGTVRRMIGHLRNLAAAAGRDPRSDVWSLPLMDAEERRAAVLPAADTGPAGPIGAGRSLHGLVARRAAAAPDAVAVSAGGRQLSYGHLDARAGRLARWLRSAGAGPESIVPIRLPRSPELAVACLGVLHAGAAYRLGPPAGPPPGDGAAAVTARRLAEIEAACVEAADAPPPDDDPGRLAVCLEAGAGLRALLTHGDVLRLLAATGRWGESAETGGEDGWLLADTAGGTAFLEPWGPLATGGRWVVAPDGADAEALDRLLAAERVTVLVDALSSLRELARDDGVSPGGDALRLVLIGGEAAEIDEAFPWLRRHGAHRPRLVALPTGPGAAVPVTYRVLEPADLDEPWRRPIGRPLPALCAVVTDPRGEPVPVGVPGELRVGAAAGRGYLGRPALTAERLVPDPFSDCAGGHLFRTGALVRRRADGDLEHLGRIDQPAAARSFGLQFVEVETFRDALGSGAGAPREAVREALERPARRRPEVPEGERVPPSGAIEQGLADIWCEVLGLEVIGATDDFFRSGGHSLAGAQAMLRTREHFGVALPVRALFEAPTVRELGAVIGERLAEEAVAGAGAGSAGSAEPLVPVPRPGPDEPGLPLSHAQERLWFLEQMDPGRPVYAMAGAARVGGGLDLPRLAAAVAGVVERHEAVRTLFPIRGARPVQEILPPFAPALPVVDLSALPERRREAVADRLAGAEARRPFDLSAGPLLRTALLRLGADSEVLLVTFHHIVSDGWSIGVFLREIAAFYAGEEGALDRLPVQYADYSVWQRRRLSGEVLERDLDWWTEHLAGAPAVLEVPADRPRPPRPSQRGVVVRLRQDGETGARRARALSAAARELEATPFMVLMAALDAFLHRYTGQDDLVVGTPVAGRDRIEVEGLIGFFVNTLVLRADAGGDPTFAELVGRVRAESLEMFAHQEVPFARLVEALQPDRDASYTPIFQVMLVADRGWIRSDLPGLPGRSFEPFLPDVGVAKFDLTFQLQESDDSLRLALEASLDLFDRATAERMLGHFATLLDQALAAPDRPLSALPLLPAAERGQLLREWNDTAADPARYPAGGLPLHRAIGHWAKETPDAVAVGRGGTTWTYAELWRRAGWLARRLRALGVGPDVLVGLSVGRDPELVLGVVATLRAGGAWLPLDPTYPADRLRYMVEDARPRVLLTRAELAAREGAGSVRELTAAAGAELVLLDRPEPPEDDAFAGPELPAPENLAYVIYTSGSTGRPKGVALSHRGLVNLCAAQAESFAPGPGDRVLQFAPASFDASVFELAMALRAGAEIRLAHPDDLLPGESLHRLLGDLRITNATMPPSALGALPSGAGGGGDLPALATVIVAGEACPPELARRWGGDGDGRRSFWNAYGPTETTVWATAERSADPDRPVTVGRPVVNARVHLVDRKGAAVPPGVPGELLIGGPGLARGYLGRPAMTAAKFMPDPFSAGVGGGRVYRTGDVARRLPDGRIDFVGRIDHQVKVRGFRIELGEIEAVLSGHPAVTEAVVVARDEGPAAESRAARLRLVGYVVPRGGDAPELPSELTARLRDRLPAYMVPSALVMLDDMPRTPAGKVDREALPAPEAGAAATGEASDPPRGKTEERIARGWAELLEIEPAAVSRSASFFDLGGHSLLATRAVARLREELAVELPVRRLFERPTVAGLAEEVETLRGGAQEDAPRLPPLVPVEREEPPPLSFAQERLWFLDRLQPGNTTYNLPVAVRLAGELDLAAFRAALGDLAARHETLRTTLVPGPDGPVQEIAAPAPLPLPVVDLSGVDPRGGGARREAEALRLARVEAATPFDLEAGPLVRAAIVRLGAAGTASARRSEHLLLLDTHHAISDGWSAGVLLRELGACYEARRRGESPALPSLPVQYADYAVWQRGWLAGGVLEEQIAYWRGALAGLPDLLELPTDRPRPPVQRFEGGAVPVDLGTELSGALGRLARERGATPFMVLLAAFHALLGRYAGQDDLAVGTPVANRTHAATEGLIGFFVNTLVLRGDLSGDPPFTELVGRARETALAAYAHQDLPFEKLVEELRPGRSLGHSPLFQVLLVLQNVPLGPLELPGLTLEPLEDDRPAAKFDLTLTLHQRAPGRGEALAGTLEFRRDLFDRETAARMAEHLRILLAGALEAPEARLSELPWLTEAERRQLRTWNETAVDHRPDHRSTGLTELIAAQAEATPERVAVISGGRHLSFGALAAAGHALAARLRALGVGPEVRVGVCAERSLELPLALVAVLGAGGAYVPFDPSYPPVRLAFMLEDSGARVLLAQEAALGAVPGLAAAAAERGVEVVRLDGAAADRAAPAPAAAPAPSSALAYVIYTSGSTGRPKGAMNAHPGPVNRLLWMRAEHGLGEGDRVLQKTPFSFDVSVWELFAPLVTGATLVMAEPGRHGDPTYLVDTVRREGVTTLHFVPSMLRAFAEAPGLEACRSVRRVIASGEALPGDLRDRLRQRLAGAELHNLYGPTETAIEVTAWPTADDPEGAPVPIGRPIANAAIHVVDPGLRPVPPGVPGELLIGGAPVGRGYLGRPALTAERFVPDPFPLLTPRSPSYPQGRKGTSPPDPFSPDVGGGRLYRTGDLARFRRDGAVEYLGRLDHQVKVRGFRIELGEIEAALEAYPAVREAVVVAAGGPRGDTRLAAYLVASAAGTEIDPDAVRAHLARTLPEYMLPAAFVVLSELPLTPSGKADRRVLPAPDWGGGGEAAYAAPRGPAEELVAGVWARVLDAERVGVHDDFFELGGHSLLAARLMGRLQEATGVELPLMRLFETPTVAGVARALERRLGGESEGGGGGDAPAAIRPVPAARRAGGLPLSPAQERLWFLDRLAPGSPWYNVPAALRLAGPLDAPALAAGLDEIVRRHEVLRTTLEESGDGPVQVVHGAAAGLAVADLSALPEPRREAEAARLAVAEARRPFDLARGLLFRRALLRLGPERHALLVTFHHTVADGGSLAVFLRELAALYGERRALPPLPIQYGDYAAWQRERLAGGVLARQLGWWRERLAGAPPVLDLPADRPRPPVQGLRGGQARFRIDPETAAGLHRLGRERGATLFMVLLAAFDAWLVRHGAGPDLVAGAPVAGRDRSETEGLIGLFVNLLPLRLRAAGDAPVADLLAAAREAVLGAHAHREVPFERLVEELKLARDPSRPPLVQAVLLLDQETPPPALPGLDVEALDLESGTAKFDLTLSLRPLPGGDSADEAGLAGVLEYDRDLFDATTATRMAGRFARLAAGLAACAGNPERGAIRLAELPLLAPAERHQLTVEWNATGTDYARGRLLHELVREQAERRPERVALVGGEEHVTYGELMRRADRLAARLRALGVLPETRVGLALDRSPLVVEALLGILVAGGAYVPLDAGYPRERLRYLVEDSGMEVLVTSGPLLAVLPVGDLAERRAVVLLGGNRRGGEAPAEAPVLDDRGASPERAAYVMYTSGSTGRPKGVVIPHRGVVRLVHEPEYLRLAGSREEGSGETGLLLATLSFDATTFEIWFPLLAGGRLAVLAREKPTLAEIAAEVGRQRVTTLFATAALYHQLVDEHLGDLAGLRNLISGGEALSPAHVRRTVEGLPGTVMVDAYGPTENSAYTSAHPVNRGLTPPGRFPDPVPIGRPIGDTTIHVVDPTLRPAAAGVPGELVTGGDGVARGYSGRPALTAERFVPDPFSHLADPPRPGARLYRTGDLARWLPSGDVEFLGRIDHQVKIRGFRVEPGEIEAALREVEGVGTVVVLVHDDLPGGKAAVAYVVPEEGSPAPGQAPEPSALREALRDRLPEFMCPAFFVPVEELPLNVNGKVDRRLLAALGSERLAERLAGGGAAARTKVPPRTPAERELAAIWEEVLGVSGIGVEDDFFDLGGHSLLATRLASRIRASLGVELPLRALFERPTVAALARRIAEAGAEAAEAPPLAPLPAERRAAGDLPLSFAQQRLWFLDRLEPGSALYSVPAAFRCSGPLRPARLARALEAVVARHEALRTTFPAPACGGEPVQRIAPPPPEGPGVPLPVVDLSALPEARRAPAVRALAEAEARRPFDLAAGPLLRALLVRSAPDDHLFFVNQHHIVSDGGSLGVFVAELAAAYGGGGPDGSGEALPPLPVQYADYAAWQREWLSGGALDRRLAFWRGHLGGVPPIELPTDRPRPPLQTFRGAARRTTLPPELAAAVRALARGHGATLFLVLLAGFETLLGRTAGQDEFAVGTPVAGRDRRELEGLIGFFVNTLALRADLSGEPTFAGLLARVRDGALDAFAHQELPFERVVDELAPERDLARPPIFQVAFALQETPPAPSLAGLELEPVELGRDLARFELGMTASDRGAAGIDISLGFNTDLFDGTRIERMLGHLRNLLAAAAEHPGRPVRTLPLLGAAERHQLLAEWNDPAVGLPLDGSGAGPSPIELFDAAAKRTPDAVALADESGALTYRALDRRVEMLARELRAAGVGAEVVVGVSMARSFDLMTALLAVLRAGGAYLPLDPSYPSGRLRFMAEDSGMRVLLADERSATELPAGGDGVVRLVIERPGHGSAGGDSRREAFRDPGPDGAAYVIYTSGSTGEPKGVVGTRRAMGNLLRDRRVATVGPSDRVLHKTPVSFDASVFEIFSPLVAGATAVLARPGGEKDAAYLVRRIAEERVTVAGSTPSMLATLLDQLDQLDRVDRIDREGADGCRSLRRMATGSEAVPPELAQRYHALGLSDLFNLYGPTETTVAVLEHPSRQRLHDRAGAGGAPPTLPIGRPMAGARIYLVDAAGEPVPAGVPGEIAIGGPSLARGYLGRPAATAERYRPDPLSPVLGAGGGGARLYRTGDLARQRPDGAVEFLGRIDRQVKVRGFRIELAEVERALTALPGVLEAAAVTQEMGGEATRRLVAYLVPESGAALDTGALRGLLAERVPEFMVPSAFVVLDALPLTPSEKIDRRALEARAAEEAAAALAGAGGAARHVPPRDELERELCGIWQDLLGVERVGVTDDFFRLGGHSLLAVRLVSRVAEATGRELPLATLFQAPTVETLARAVRGEGAAGRSGVLVPLHEPARVAGEPPLFLVHAVGGAVFAYRPLAEALAAAGPPPPVYGLQARGLTPGEAPHETVEEMAEAYLEAVADARPRGPYRLGGWSLGALVAYEMARRLQARGEAVELLALIDPTPPGQGEPGAVDDLAFVRLVVHDLLALSGARTPVPLDELERDLRGEIEEALASGGWEAALDRALARTAEAGVLPPHESRESLRRIASVYRANTVAAARYRPGAGIGTRTGTGPRAGAAPALVLCAAESPASRGLARWREVLGGKLEERRLPGDHYSLLRPPRVVALAAAITARLADAERLEEDEVVAE
jgi:amino acid adenylation domain-containing protein